MAKLKSEIEVTCPCCSSVLVIDKNVSHLAKIADRHFMIERGRTVWSGTSEQLLAEPDLQHRYLGI